MKIDDFESVFRSAVKERFRLTRPEVRSVMLITDLAGDRAEKLAARVKEFLHTLRDPTPAWTVLSAEQHEDTRGIMRAVDEHTPDLIVTHRNLNADKELRFTLGAAVDTLTQATATPILLLADASLRSFELARGTSRVMVVTDHLTGDDRLVSWGVRVCGDNGTLYLAHVEDDRTFERYIDVIGRISGIDTERARASIASKLLQLPTDYIATIKEEIAARGLHERVEPIVVMGHAIADYRRLIDEHDMDLLVLDSKDQSQQAMRTMTYALSVELRARPMLLL